MEPSNEYVKQFKPDECFYPPPRRPQYGQPCHSPSSNDRNWNLRIFTTLAHRRAIVVSGQSSGCFTYFNAKKQREIWTPNGNLSNEHGSGDYIEYMRRNRKPHICRNSAAYHIRHHQKARTVLKHLNLVLSVRSLVSSLPTLQSGNGQKDLL